SPDESEVQAEEPLPEPEGFDWDLVKGVWKHEAEIDELVMRYSRHWRKDRMGKIELTILRIGVYETLFAEDVPPKVAIDEAVELAKSFAGGAAVGFVNGVLDAALRDRKRA
ncbi:MAG: transcription antitermination factor NusB, partial [Desulfovibrio sp.]|nr:transcription antitermination factor NusB [Desulfovibrio sp.]